MKKIIYYLFILCYLNTAQAQTLEWLKNADPGHSFLTKIRSSSEDRVFATGYIYVSTTFDDVNYPSSGLDDIFLAEFDQDGSILWLVTAGAMLHDDRPADMVIDDVNDFIYITGSTGENAFFEQEEVTYQDRSIFLAKYDFDGNLIWLKTPGENGGVTGYSLDLDDDGNIYLSGQVEGTSIFENETFVNLGSFLASYAPDGSLNWVQAVKGNVNYSDIEINVNDDLLYAGHYRDSIHINGDAIYATTAEQEDVFIARFDLQGQHHSLIRGAGPGRNYLVDVTSDSNGEFIMAGWANPAGALTFQNMTLAGSENYYLRYDPTTDNVLLLDNFGDGYFAPSELMVDPADKLLVTGIYNVMASLNGNPLPTEYIVEAFICGYDNNDVPEWYFTGNGGLSDRGASMCLLSTGDLFLGGTSGDTMRMDGLEISTGTFDINFFIAKFSGLTTSLQKPIEKLFTVYPNPVRETIYIDFGKAPVANTYFEMYNTVGELQRSEKVNSQNVMIERGGLSDGLYFWTLRNTREIFANGKLIFTK